MIKTFKRPESYVNAQKDLVDGKNILITGGTSGIGKEAAFALGRLGANVYVHGRDKERGREVVNTLRKTIGTKSAFIRGDFSKLSEVRAVSANIEDEVDELDVLINNAGGFFRGNKTGTDGLEYTFLVNHLAGFLLTIELLPLLEKSNGQSKLVQTSSEAHRYVDGMELSAVQNGTNGWTAYSRSKLANVMFTLSLARKLDDAQISANAVHPGVIPGSAFLRNIPGPVDKLGGAANYVPLPGIKSSKEGGAALVHAVGAEGVREHSGVYYANYEPKRPAQNAQDTDMQDALWDFSMDVTNAEIDSDLSFLD